MDLYILDESLRREYVIDEYESLIWAERYSEYGDFELKVLANRRNRTLLTPEAKVAINQSDRLMVIDEVGYSEGDDGARVMVVKGFSIEKFLDNRVTRGSGLKTGVPIIEKIIRSGTPSYVAYDTVDRFCISNTANPEDNIEMLNLGPHSPPGSIPLPEGEIEFEIPYESVYSTVKRVCGVYGMGFRIVRVPDEPTLYFEVYMGNNKTTAQSDFSPVIFSQSLERLLSSNEFISTGNTKNVAYVFSPNGSRIVYADLVSPNISGIDRRILVVNAQDIDLPAGAELQAALEQRGKEELAEHRNMHLFDGEVPQDGFYIYGRDYSLGDLVEMRNEEGLTAEMRVTEQIFISDAEGVRSYPTLETSLLITPGSWFSWDSNVVWQDAVGTWQDS